MDSLSYEECKVFSPILSEAKCVKVYDGDTFHLGTILPEPYGATRFCVRLLGVDTPELRTKNPAEKSLAREARQIVKEYILNKMVKVKVSGYDKYGRLLARIVIPDGRDLSQCLIDERVAIYYDGGKKNVTSWESLLKQHTELRSSRVNQERMARNERNHSQS
jgi:micrococcal nuclease